MDEFIIGVGSESDESDYSDQSDTFDDEYSSRHYQSSFFVKIFLQNNSGFIVALNHKRQHLIII